MCCCQPPDHLYGLGFILPGKPIARPRVYSVCMHRFFFPCCSQGFDLRQIAFQNQGCLGTDFPSPLQAVQHQLPAHGTASDSHHIQHSRNPSPGCFLHTDSHGFLSGVGDISYIQRQRPGSCRDLPDFSGVLCHNGAGACCQHHIGAVMNGNRIGNAVDQRRLFPDLLHDVSENTAEILHVLLPFLCRKRAVSGTALFSDVSYCILS